MKLMQSTVVAAAVLALAPSLLAQEFYYATKADERAGRKTFGRAPSARVAPGPNAGGDTCAAAVVIPNGAGDYTDSGTTTGANNTVTTIQAGCAEYTTVAGPDVIYTFSLGPLAARGTPLTITLAPTTPAYDAAIYTLSTAGPGCPAGTANAVTNCVNGADAGFAGGTETITDAETDLMPAGTYFLFVDSFYTTAAGNGNYNLTVGARPFPVELMEFSVQ